MVSAQPLKPQAVLPEHSSRYNTVQGTQSKLLNDIIPSGFRELKEGDIDRFIHDLANLGNSTWERKIHMDGKPYFHDPKRKIVTEAYILDNQVRKNIEALYVKIEDLRLSRKLPQMKIDSEELYLTLEPKEGYYFVDHTTESIFWLEDVPLDMIKFRSKPPVRSFSLFMKMNYYNHLENFPGHTELPRNAESLLRSTLTHACVDHLTSRDFATASWNANDCKTFLDLINGELEHDYKTWIVARLYGNILHSQWIFHHGMREACNDRLSAFNAQPNSLTPWDFVFVFLCFFSPYTYARKLQSVQANRAISPDGWNGLLGSLLTEWSDSNLLATVSLTANMALLALPTLSSASKYLSIISTLFAIGSIILGLHHVWRHRVKLNSDAGEAGAYFRNAMKRFKSLHLLSILLSLPLVLLLWSIFTFGLAVIMFGFNDQKPWWLALILAIILASILITVGFFFEIFSSGTRWIKAVKDLHN